MTQSVFPDISREWACLLQMTVIMEECEASTEVLQSQVDEARERSQRELDELRRQLQEKSSELEKTRQAAKRLQEEVGEQQGGADEDVGVVREAVRLLTLQLPARPQLLPLEEDLRMCRREQQEAQQRGRQLEQKVKELEERSTAAVGDRERQVKLMEVKNYIKIKFCILLNSLFDFF